MKSIIAVFLALVVATPAIAGSRHHNPYRVDNHHHHRSRISTGDAIAIGIGGIILGAAINEANKAKEKEIIVVKQQKCDPVTIIVQDQWGNVLEKRTEVRCTVY